MVDSSTNESTELAVERDILICDFATGPLDDRGIQPYNVGIAF